MASGRRAGYRRLGPHRHRIRSPFGGRAVHYWRSLGPGLVTGASDNDPSGIGTYSVAGATTGYRLLWMGVFTMPLLVAGPEWGVVLRNTFVPHVSASREFLAAMVAVLGTTISPYMFFWITSQEVEEEEGRSGPDLDDDPVTAPMAERRRRVDVVTGMAYAYLVYYFVVVNPVKALVYAAILQGFLAPVLVLLLTVVSRDRDVMGRHRSGWFDVAFGFLTADVMAGAAAALIVVTVLG